MVPRRDIAFPDLVTAQLLQHLRYEFRTVAHPQHQRWSVPQCERHLQLLRQPLSGDRPLDDVQHRQPGALVDHRRDLDGLPVDGRVELKVKCPYDFRCIGFDLRTGTDTGAFARVIDPHLQPFLFPESVRLLLVHRHARIVRQIRPGAPEPVERVLPGVGGSGKPNYFAGQPLRQLHPPDEHVHGSALGSRG